LKNYKGISSKNEIALWMGDTANGSSNLNQYDGYVKIINGFAASATTTTMQTLLLLMLWLLMRYMLFQLKY
jgi:hypothetical protein